MSINPPSKDTQMINAFLKGITNNQPPQKTEFNLIRSHERGSYTGTSTIGKTTVSQEFLDTNNNQAFDWGLDKAVHSPESITQVDGKPTFRNFIDDNSFEDGKVTWDVEQPDGTTASYDVAFKNEKHAIKLGKQFRKAAEKNEAEAFLKKHAVKE